MIKCKIAITEDFDCKLCCFTCSKQETCKQACDLNPENCENQVNVPDDGDSLQVFEQAVPATIETITQIVLQMEDLKKQEEAFRQELLTAMETYGVKKFENDKVSFTYVPESTRTSIDSTKLKKLHPDIAEECSKTSTVKASVRIKVK